MIVVIDFDKYTMIVMIDFDKYTSTLWLLWLILTSTQVRYDCISKSTSIVVHTYLLWLISTSTKVHYDCYDWFWQVHKYTVIAMIDFEKYTSTWISQWFDRPTTKSFIIFNTILLEKLRLSRKMVGILHPRGGISYMNFQMIWLPDDQIINHFQHNFAWKVEVIKQNGGHTTSS